jgi:hypothetical protein
MRPHRAGRAMFRYLESTPRKGKEDAHMKHDVHMVLPSMEHHALVQPAGPGSPLAARSPSLLLPGRLAHADVFAASEIRGAHVARCPRHACAGCFGKAVSASRRGQQGAGLSVSAESAQRSVPNYVSSGGPALSAPADSAVCRRCRQPGAVSSLESEGARLQPT